MLAPETVTSSTRINRPHEIVDLSEADREPEWSWSEE
jgi:hypothetical protein